MDGEVEEQTDEWANESRHSSLYMETQHVRVKAASHKFKATLSYRAKPK